MNNLSSHTSKCGAFTASLLFLLLIQISGATFFDDAPDANDISSTKVFLPQLDIERTSIVTNGFPNNDDLTWSIKSRGLRVGEITKKVSNKKDSMGKLVKGMKEGEAISQENTKAKSMLASKLSKSNAGMNTAKKIKAKAPAIPAGVAPATIPTSTSVLDPVTSSPSISPTSASSSPSLAKNIVRLEDYYMSFVAPDATRSPTTEEFSEMLLRITAYFDVYLTEYLALNRTISFDRIETINDFNLYGTPEAGQPEERYNIYMNFNISDFIFAPDTVELPTSNEIFTILLTSITPDFIINVVRTYLFTPFESTNEVYCGTSSYMDGPP